MKIWATNTFMTYIGLFVSIFSIPVDCFYVVFVCLNGRQGVLMFSGQGAFQKVRLRWNHAACNLLFLASFAGEKAPSLHLHGQLSWPRQLLHIMEQASGQWATEGRPPCTHSPRWPSRRPSGHLPLLASLSKVYSTLMKGFYLNLSSDFMWVNN